MLRRRRWLLVAACTAALAVPAPDTASARPASGPNLPMLVAGTYDTTSWIGEEIGPTPGSVALDHNTLTPTQQARVSLPGVWTTGCRWSVNGDLWVTIHCLTRGEALVMRARAGNPDDEGRPRVLGSGTWERGRDEGSWSGTRRPRVV